MLHKEVTMNKVSPEVFISQWLPSHIKNKILFYLFKSPHSKGGQVITGTFHFGEKSYKVTSKQNIERFLPFRNDDFKRNIVDPKNTMSKYYVHNESRNDFLIFQKVMKSFVYEMDTIRMKNNKHMQLVKAGKELKQIESKSLDTNNLRSVEYINEMVFGNFPCGLIQSEKETIVAHYKPYNNGCSRNHLIHSDITCKIISISPLQMLWRIHDGLVTVKEKRELAKINRISGRSKLKTNADYIRAFLEL